MVVVGPDIATTLFEASRNSFALKGRDRTATATALDASADMVTKSRGKTDMSVGGGDDRLLRFTRSLHQHTLSHVVIERGKAFKIGPPRGSSIRHMATRNGGKAP